MADRAARTARRRPSGRRRRRCPSARALAARLGDPLATVGLGKEAVQRRADARVFLRTIDLEVAGCLVELVLDGVGRHDLDVAGHQVRRLVAERHAMPGMTLEESTDGGHVRVALESTHW